MCRRASTPWVLTALLALTVGLAPRSIAAETRKGSTVDLPKTFAKVWYRAGQRKGLAGLRAFKAAGDLTLTREGLEFHSGKDSFSIPLEAITIVSYGKIGRDVDTDWAVVGLREAGIERLIAFKDGKALGYGGDTPVIFNTLRSAMRQLGGAHYNVPEGWTAYDTVDDQIAFRYPADWHVHVPSAISVGGATPWGSFLISPRELEGGRELLEEEKILERVADPDNREFFLLREEVLPHMNCSGIRRKALPELLERAAGDALFEQYELIEPPRSTPVTIAGCEGLRIVARGRNAEGVEALVDLRHVAKRDTLFTFGVRSLASGYDAHLEVLEPVVETARFALAVE